MNASMNAPKTLTTQLVEKVWGRTQLPPPFIAPDGQRIGEIWFEPPVELPEILAKYLFTSEKLSVQVHPSAEQALAGEAGKEECWLVLEAEPDARLAIGFKDAINAQDMRAAALDGSIEHLLEWHSVKAGDFFHLTPGTVHAIGPGLSLVEIQQNSDTTFRLFDYGRPRELHLDRAIDVALGMPYSDNCKGHIGNGSSCLLDGAYFRLDRIVGAPDQGTVVAFDGPLLVMPLDGEIGLAASQTTPVSGQQSVPLLAGDCAYAPSISALDFVNSKVALLVRPNG